MLEKPQVLSTVVDKEEEGLMVKEVITGRLGLTRGLLRRMKKGGGVFLNGQRDYLTRRVKAGDQIQIVFFDEKTGLEPEPLPLNVVFEDEFLLVVNKPAGMPVHPTGSYQSGTLANALAHYWSAQGLETKVRLVHRLDKDTSGLLLVAKDPYTLHELLKQLGRRELVREYLVLVDGCFTTCHGVIEAPIGRAKDHGVKRTADPQGKAAKTVFKVLAQTERASLLRARLESGRTHQIRVHLAHVGHPVVGDPLYSQPLPGFSRQALHSWRLEFVHPRTNEQHTITCPMPADMLAVWKKLREGESVLCRLRER